MKSKNDFDKLNKTPKEDNFWITNPLASVGNLTTVEPQAATRASANRLYAGYNKYVEKKSSTFDYYELFDILKTIIKNKNDVTNLFYSLHNVFINKLNTYFTAIGLYNNSSKCINLKLIDQIGSMYSSKIFMSNTPNPIVNAVTNKNIVIQENNEFLNVPYLSKAPSLIIPLEFKGHVKGVFIIGDNAYKDNCRIYEFIAEYVALFIENKDLSEQVSQGLGTDTLTGLCNHRTFQEKLSQELTKSQKTGNPLTIVLFDINNISSINKELGHSKGDEIIKLVANKISQNMRSNDVAGRYGGDELAIIMPETDINEAKYLAEYLTYLLSCCLVDDVGPIKVSVGLASYPHCASEQDKLLILAEQAMYISRSKGYQNGMTTIVSSEDFDFWDDMALNSFASVLAKRHASIGINFEEELVNKFLNEDIINQNHLIDVVTSLATAIDAKDEYTKDHSTSVSRYSEALAKALNLPEKEVERIKLGALLHDVGKIGVPENILRKPSQLDDDEWNIMKQHPTIGAEKVLLPNKALHDLIPIIKYHHEHIDGTGYPEKLKGDEIPYSTRIVSIADAFHALVSDRPYRKGLGVEKACGILKLGAGIQWDKDMVRVFVQIAPSLVTKI